MVASSPTAPLESTEKEINITSSSAVRGTGSMSDNDKTMDLEAGNNRDHTSLVDPKLARIKAIQQSNPVLRALVGLENRIDKITKFEAMGVERVPDDERKPPQILNVSCLLILSPYVSF